MSVYKYDENTQMMREYNVAYQVKDQDCPAPPNGIDVLTTSYNSSSDSNAKFKIDSSWLPYFAVESGQINIGSYGDSNYTFFWNAVNEIFLEPTDVPVRVAGNLSLAEQIYIYNKSRWGITSAMYNDMWNGGKRVFFRDDNNDASYGSYYGPGSDLYCLWIPNGEVITHSEGSYGRNINTIIYCGKNIRVNDNEGGSTTQTLYYNDDAIVSTPFEDAGFKGTLILFAKNETEWLENYFNIEQDGTTLNWYEDILINEVGKYIRLKKDGTTLTEKCYWIDGEIKEEIGKNLTDNTVTKTGSITVGDLTKTYSITQKPIKRTVKARMYFNPAEEDGKLYNNFCVWPFNANFEINNNDWNQIVDYMIKIRYKAVGDTTWTDMNVPTVSELKQKSTQIAGHDGVQIIDLYTIEINTAGYYDVEWMFDADSVYSFIDPIDTGQNQWVFSDRKMWYDYTNQNYEAKVNEDMSIENTPFVVSLDYGTQYAAYGVGKHGYTEYFGIRDWDDNPRMETLSIGPTDNTGADRQMFNGMMSRGLKYLVYNNIGGDGHYDWINCENSNDTFSNEGILYYNMPARYSFQNWWLGVSTTPHTIYLHPDIYTMTNHGFNDEVSGWSGDIYNQLIDRGCEILELPTNWRELVPNYIGE